jgi:hypothetical protein
VPTLADRRCHVVGVTNPYGRNLGFLDLHVGIGNLTPWPESASELYRLSDRRLSAKIVPTFANRGSHVVSVMDPYGRIVDFLDRHYFLPTCIKQFYL